ncbi:hypothetical protein [Streptomyces sp. EN23]|nr:hypothetical protein [Streptomyces sp. EN23]
MAQLLDDAFAARAGACVRFPAPWPRRRGTSEVQREIISWIGLGMPRVRR